MATISMEPISKVEPISIATMERYCLFPIVHHDIWQLYKTQQEKFWLAEEVSFTEDRKSWQTLNEDEQKFIGITLAFFANSDNVVLENVSTRLMKEICIPEAQAFLSLQSAIEMIHVETYNLCIDNVIQDTKEKMDLFKAVQTNPIVQPKIEWAMKWMKTDQSLAHVLVGFAIVEGIFFASSFASIFWLRKRQKLPGVCFANEKIVEDESLHVRFDALMYRNYIQNKLSTEEIYKIVEEAVELEHQFVEKALPVKLIGMNSELMKQYVCKVADVVLSLLGVSPLYNVENPFEWMVGLGLLGKSNFFEKRVAEYGKPRKENEIRENTINQLGTELDF